MKTELNISVPNPITVTPTGHIFLIYSVCFFTHLDVKPGVTVYVRVILPFRPSRRIRTTVCPSEIRNVSSAGPSNGFVEIFLRRTERDENVVDVPVTRVAMVKNVSDFLCFSTGGEKKNTFNADVGVGDENIDSGEKSERRRRDVCSRTRRPSRPRGNRTVSRAGRVTKSYSDGTAVDSSVSQNPEPRSELRRLESGLAK